MNNTDGYYETFPQDYIELRREIVSKYKQTDKTKEKHLKLLRKKNLLTQKLIELQMSRTNYIRTSLKQVNKSTKTSDYSEQFLK